MAKKKKAAKKKTAKKAAKKAARKVAKKPAKKAAKKVASKRKPPKRASKKSPVLPTPAPSTITLHPGDVAPNFTAQDENGIHVSLTQLMGKPLVIYFYPKDDTPGCTKEACDFRDSWSRVQQIGAVVIGISRDTVESHRRFKEKYSLPIALLADVDGKICEAYGIWKEKSLYGRKFMGIERTTFVVDRGGRITRIFPKVKVEGHVDEVIEALRGL